jgi:apolipoprotein N-acyltransferase
VTVRVAGGAAAGAAAGAAGTTVPAGTATGTPARPRPRWWTGALAATGAGLALLLAFPPYDLWPLAPVGVALLDLALTGRRVRAAAGLGALCGLVFFTPLLAWTGLHVGALPWLLLSGSQAAYLALLGAAAAVTGPLARRWRWAGPPLTGVLWTAQEALRDRTPFGGFPWGRLAFSQADSPLLGLARLGGAPLVTFAVALTGGLLAAAVRALLADRALLARARWRAAVPVALAVALVGLAAAVPTPAPTGRVVTVAVVQGNVPRLGFDFNAQRRAVLDNHVEATLALARDVAAGRAAHPDLVIWPENASDIDPLRNADARARISAAAAEIGAPILVGALLEGPGEHYRNAAIVWQQGGGPADVYVKRHPVPFAEYIPLRPVARRVSAEVDRVGSDFVGGNQPGVLRVGPATVGDVICFEVAYDGLVRDTVTGGGQLLVVQTNNATFDPAEARQQLAMVRLRAVEHGLDTLMDSTVGISGFVSTDGTVSGATAFNTRATEVRELRLGSARTLATRLGAGPEYALVAAALLALVAAAGWRGATYGRSRRVRPSSEGET